jgi:peroxiredoxin
VPRLHLASLTRAIAVVSLVLSSVACGATAGAGVPRAEIARLGGGRVRLSEHIGREAVILVFWDTECDGCMQQMPAFVALERRYRDRGLVVFAVATDGPQTRANVAGVAQARGIELPILLDESTVLVHRYNPRVDRPFTLFFGRSGKVAKRLAGQYIVGNGDDWAPLIEAMLAEAPAAPASPR